MFWSGRKTLVRTAVAASLLLASAGTGVVTAATTAAATPVTVTVDKGSIQSDPTNASPIVFRVVFSEGVTGFDSQADVVLSGSAGATTATITASDTQQYLVSVSGMTGSGNVKLAVVAGAATSIATSTPSDASPATSVAPKDNSVAFQSPPAPTVAIDQGNGQLDPTTSSPIMFKVQFSVDVTGFTDGDVVITGTANATTATVTAVDPTFYSVAISGMTTSGTVIVTIPDGAAIAVSDPHKASITSPSSDAIVTWSAPPAPTATINQAVGQLDPTSSSPVLFDVVFSEAVTGFDQTDVLLNGGTTGATTKTVTPIDASHYTVAISGMTATGTITVSIAASAAVAVQDPRLGSLTSPSTDAAVTWNLPPAPTVTINQASGQLDPTNSSPILFTVVFSEDVTGFDQGDVALNAGTTGATTKTVTSIDASHYAVAISGMTAAGTITVSIPGSATTAVRDPHLPSAASTSTDNAVVYNPLGVHPTVSIDQGATQADPTSATPVLFAVIFSEAVQGLTGTDVTLSGTAGATTAVITAIDTTHYTVAVSGMTTSGTVIASIGADAAQAIASPNFGSTASTSTDNTVTYAAPQTTPAPSTSAPTPTSTNPTTTATTSVDLASTGSPTTRLAGAASLVAVLGVLMIAVAQTGRRRRRRG
jgi:hypothetical protein